MGNKHVSSLGFGSPQALPAWATCNMQYCSNKDHKHFQPWQPWRKMKIVRPDRRNRNRCLLRAAAHIWHNILPHCLYRRPHIPLNMRNSASGDTGQQPVTLLGASRCNQQIIVKALLKRGCTLVARTACTLVARTAMHYPTQQCLTRFLLERLWRQTLMPPRPKQPGNHY